MKRFSILSLLCALLITATLYAGTANLPNTRVLLLSTGTPSAGSNEIQTITFGSGQVSGVFFLRYNNQTTPQITWSATNATLVANIDAALETLSNISTSGVVTAVDTMTAGIGTITVTFSGTKNAKAALNVMTVPSKTTSGTIAVTRSTPGVAADGRMSVTGTLLLAPNSGSPILYSNTGAPPSPVWTQIAP